MFIKKIKVLHKENGIISKVRDTLLPKLISGELKIQDAEKVVEEAGILMSLITEEQVELQRIEWFKELGYQYKDGYEIAPEGVNPERDDFRQVILEERFKSALIKINPDIPNQTIQNSIPQILNPNIPGLLNCNREMHKWITKGLKVTFMEDNQEIGRQLKLIDFENIDNNDWLVVNQFEIQGDQRLRRPDVLVFVNGLAFRSY